MGNEYGLLVPPEVLRLLDPTSRQNSGAQTGGTRYTATDQVLQDSTDHEEAVVSAESHAGAALAGSKVRAELAEQEEAAKTVTSTLSARSAQGASRVTMVGTSGKGPTVHESPVIAGQAAPGAGGP